MDVRARSQADAFTTKDGSTIRELMHTQSQSLAEAIVAPGQTTERHFHARSEELYSFLDGGGVLEVEGDLREVAAGDTARIPAGAWHAFTAGATGARFLCCCAPPYSHDDTFLEGD